MSVCSENYAKYMNIPCVHSTLLFEFKIVGNDIGVLIGIKKE
jgi:hypothetical protein